MMSINSDINDRQGCVGVWAEKQRDQGLARREQAAASDYGLQGDGTVVRSGELRYSPIEITASISG